MNNYACGIITITDRKNIDLTGVVSVDSFDEYMISLTVSCGTLIIEGEDLHITVLDLDKGKVSARGNINSVYYTDVSAGKKQGFVSRIFNK